MQGGGETPPKLDGRASSGGLLDDASDPSDSSSDDESPSDPEGIASGLCVREKSGPSQMPRIGVSKETKLPYCTSLRFEEGSRSVTRAVVVIHGTGRNVDKYFDTMYRLLNQNEQHYPAQTVVVAPYFQAAGPDCVDGNGDHSDHPEPDDLHWGCGWSWSWKDGKDALNDREHVSSFDALDALVKALQQSFPSLEEVTVTGFSAGGQFVQRYAAASPDVSGIKLRYVIGDPSSYLYFDNARLMRGQTCKKGDCNLSAASFKAPYFDEERCPNYNDYRFGFGGTLPRYLDGASAESLRDRYIGRDITYVMGELDNGPTSKAGYSSLDDACGAEAQGPIEKGKVPPDKTVYHSYRAQRALTYWNYMKHVHQATHPEIVWAANCGHDQTCVYKDPQVSALLFPQ